MKPKLLIPLEYEIYTTEEKEKLYITTGYDEKNQIYYFLYSYKDIDDVICAGIDIEWLEYKKKMFVEERNLKLLKEGRFK